jgi:hypothetical protein
VSKWKTGVLSVIDQQFIGVVSTQTEIWFFEKGVKITSIVLLYAMFILYCLRYKYQKKWMHRMCFIIFLSHRACWHDSEHYPTGNNRSKSYIVNMILISLNTSNFSSNIRISRELSIRSDENYVVSSMVTTTVVLLEIWTLVFSEISQSGSKLGAL